MPESGNGTRRPKILVGTAFWTDQGLIKCGRFYPKGCSSAEARLRYYASRFPMVEVNSSYYALPSQPTPSSAPGGRWLTSDSTSRRSAP